MTTLPAAACLQNELRRECRKLRFDSLFTALTALGLGVGIAYQLTAAPPTFVIAAFGLAYL